MNRVRSSENVRLKAKTVKSVYIVARRQTSKKYGRRKLLNVQRRLHFNSKQTTATTLTSITQHCRDRSRCRFSHRTQLTIILLTRFEVFDKYIITIIQNRKKRRTHTYTRKSQFAADIIRCNRAASGLVIVDRAQECVSKINM